MSLASQYHVVLSHFWRFLGDVSAKILRLWSSFQVFWRKVLITFLTLLLKISYFTVVRLIFGEIGALFVWRFLGSVCVLLSSYNLMKRRGGTSEQVKFLLPHCFFSRMTTLKSLFSPFFSNWLEVSWIMIDWRLGIADVEGTLLH